MDSGKDKRRFLRMGAFLEGTFQTQDGKNGLVMLTNFNREGIKASLNRKLPSGEIIKLEIWIPGSIIPVFASAQIVWTGKSSEDWTYEYDSGVRINEIDEGDRQRILDFAYENWKQTRGKV